MKEMKPCPFCGGKSEIYTGRTFPYRGKATCGSEEEAREKLEEYKAIGTVVNYCIGPHSTQRANMKKAKVKWRVAIDMRAFIPRCCNSDCLGRTQAMFLTEKEAIEAWNTRSDHAERPSNA